MGQGDSFYSTLSKRALIIQASVTKTRGGLKQAKAVGTASVGVSHRCDLGADSPGVIHQVGACQPAGRKRETENGN